MIKLFDGLIFRYVLSGKKVFNFSRVSFASPRVATMPQSGGKTRYFTRLQIIGNATTSSPYGRTLPRNKYTPSLHRHNTCASGQIKNQEYETLSGAETQHTSSLNDGKLKLGVKRKGLGGGTWTVTGLCRHTPCGGRVRRRCFSYIT